MVTTANLVVQFTTDTGTGNLTLQSMVSDTVPQHFRNFATVFGTGSSNKFYYAIRSRVADEFEVGIGHMSNSTTMVRDSVIESSNANSLVNFSAGSKDVITDMPASLQNVLTNTTGTNSGDISFTFQPGGTASASTFTTWASLMAVVNTIPGIKYITVDDTIAPAHITTGNWNLAGVTIYALSSNPLATVLIVDNGVTFSSLPAALSGSILLRSDSNSPVYSISSGQGLMFLTIGASIACNGSAEFIKVSNGASLILLVDLTSSIQLNNYEVVNVIGVGSEVEVFLGEFGQLPSGTIRGDADGTLGIFVISSSAQYDAFQTNFAGSVFIANLCTAANTTYDNTANAYSGTDVQAVLAEIGRHRIYGLGQALVSATSVNAAETDLLSITSNTAIGFQEVIHVVAFGVFASNINAKTLKLYVNGTVVYSTTSLLLNGGRWKIDAYIIGSSGPASEADAFTDVSSTNATLGAVTGGKVAVFADFTADYEIKVTGQGTTTGDVIAQFFKVEKTRSIP